MAVLESVPPDTMKKNSRTTAKIVVRNSPKAAVAWDTWPNVRTVVWSIHGS